MMDIKWLNDSPAWLVRERLDQDVIADYIAALTIDPSALPPIVVYYDRDEQVFWVADGLHRIAAAVALGWTEVDAEIRQGTREDAETFALTEANVANGHRLTNDDKRKKARSGIAKWPQHSSRQIAEWIGVSDFLVREVRDQVRDSRTSTVIGADGKQYPATQPKKDAPQPAAKPEPAATPSAPDQAAATNTPEPPADPQPVVTPPAAAAAPESSPATPPDPALSLAAVVPVVGGDPVYTPAEQERDELRGVVDMLTEEVDKLRSVVEGKLSPEEAGLLSDAMAEIATLQAAVAERDARIKVLEVTDAATKSRLDDLVTENAALKRQVKAQRRELDGLKRAA